MTDLYTLEQGLVVADDLISEHKRWGRMAGIGIYSPEQVIEALTVLRKHGTFDATDADLKGKLTKANRQLGAAKAREAKLLKRIAEFEVAKAAEVRQ